MIVVATARFLGGAGKAFVPDGRRYDVDRHEFAEFLTAGLLVEVDPVDLPAPPMVDHPMSGAGDPASS